MKKIIFIFIILSLIISCKTTNPLNFKKASLYGMIYDYDSRPISGVQLTVDGTSKITSDLHGRFMIMNCTKGPHSILLNKADHEVLTMDFDFLNRTQILYFKMASANYLLAETETYFEKHNWIEAEKLLKRVEKIDAANTAYLYLKAVFKFRTGSHEEAKTILNSVLENGFKEAYIYLTLADIYQYKIKNNESAIKNLEDYLKLKIDPDTEKRLKSLKAISPSDKNNKTQKTDSR